MRWLAMEGRYKDEYAARISMNFACCRFQMLFRAITYAADALFASLFIVNDAINTYCGLAHTTLLIARAIVKISTQNVSRKLDTGDNDSFRYAYRILRA